jgi:hypothetical protein
MRNGLRLLTVFVVTLGLGACSAVKLKSDGGDAGGADTRADRGGADMTGAAGQDGAAAGQDGAAAGTSDTAGSDAGADTTDAPATDLAPDLGSMDLAPDVSTADASDGGTTDVATSDGAPDEHATDAPAESAPACAMPFHDDWKQALSCTPIPGIPWYAVLGSPSSDDDYNMMVGHYDSIQRVDPLPGGYTMSFDLTIDDDLDFYVGMPAVSLDVPSLVRMGDKILLTGSHWDTTALVPLVETDFDGKLVANGPMHVTYYVQATSRSCAMRVDLGGHTYRSGFVKCANGDNAVDGKDVSTPQLTGNVSFGTLGYAHIGEIEGCADLSDAAISAAYAR